MRSDAVSRATPYRITFEKTFKYEVAQRTMMGESASTVFRAHGLGPELIPYEKAQCYAAQWRSALADDPMAEISRLRARVNELESRLRAAGLPAD